MPKVKTGPHTLLKFSLRGSEAISLFLDEITIVANRYNPQVNAGIVADLIPSRTDLLELHSLPKGVSLSFEADVEATDDEPVYIAELVFAPDLGTKGVRVLDYGARLHVLLNKVTCIVAHGPDFPE